jgi:hypothetical protein
LKKFREAKAALCDCRGRVVWLRGPARALFRGNPFSPRSSVLGETTFDPRSSQLFHQSLFLNLGKDGMMVTMPSVISSVSP